MPSGAKRRKAAKKKKENITNPISEESQHEQGNGDSSKSHDEKDSDSGSVSSPTAHQHHHNPLSKDEFYEEEKSGQPLVELGEKSDLGGDGVVEVTKEVDFESRVVDIEPWKESNVEIVKEGETSFGDSIGGVDLVEKKIEIDPTKMEELSEPKDAVKVEPDVGSQSGEATQVVEVNVVEKIGDSSITDVLVEEREQKILLQSNGTSIEINNGSGDPIVSQIPPNSDNQTKDVAPVPPVVQPASWKSCCGLFDVFTSSNR